MEIRTIQSGFGNCYIVLDKKPGSTKKTAIVIDPVCELTDLLDFDVKMCLATHGHADHIKSAKAICDHFKIPLSLHKSEAIYATDDSFNLSFYVLSGPLDKISDLNLLEDGMELSFINHTLKVMHTPGHSKGSVMYLLDDKYLFSGDTVFKDGIGRTDLPGSSQEQMAKTIDKLLAIDEDYEVLPGHGHSTSYKEVKKALTYWRRFV